MTTVLEESGTLAVLGRGPLGLVFLGLGLVALALGIWLRKAPWFLAAVAVPGTAAGLVGAIVWGTGDLSFRWLLITAPLAIGAIFATRREGILQTSNAMIMCAVITATFFLAGALAAFLYDFQG